MRYVDGFVIPVPKKNLRACARMAKKACVLRREHGAIDTKECSGDDLRAAFGVPFPRMMKLKPGETVVFSYIVYKSRAHRDRVNAEVMNDPRVEDMCDPKTMPFDGKRMVYGGFKVLKEIGEVPMDRIATLHRCDRVGGGLAFLSPYSTMTS
ncbi:MAG: DUF1428 family protein [Deltaproteobacteria bacterium]